MTSLLDLMVAPPILKPCEPNGGVIQGRPHTVFHLEHPKKLAWAQSRIEVHPHTDGTWMWSTSVSTYGEDGQSGHTYAVGPKWGKFAASKEDAIYWAAREIEDHINKKKTNGESIKRIRAWLSTIRHA
jgi:hypothetical protein